jgi:hypothetical protein
MRAVKVEAIVYESNTGFTRKYAELLSEATGLKVYERRTAGGSLKKGAAVLYMGWLMAGSVKGFKKACGRYRIKALAAVGMGSPSDKSSADTVQKYTTEDMPVFYLQGGLDVGKLRGLYKFMMSSAGKATENSPDTNDKMTDEERGKRDLFKNGGNFVKKENLEQLMAWIQ